MMEQSDTQFDQELRTGAQHLARSLVPESGAIPQISGVDIYGRTVPLNGIAGGDLISYIDFHERYDLDVRIANALAQGREGMAQTLERLRHKGGVLLADVAGHEFTDAIRALMLHQAIHTAALYEMDLNGEITVRLFEQVNTRFYRSRTLRRLAGDSDTLSFITLIYGEISHTGRFRFVSAGHPQPLVFSREYDRFVDISQDRLVSYPPLGLQLCEDHPDAKIFKRPLGYKKQYTVNELNLMGRGDVLLLYSDGLLDPFSAYTQQQLERAVSRARDGTAKEICEEILEDRRAGDKLTDDLSLVVIKYN
jgi:serine phosphatase RsbU (regulator of sigma subunit)